MRHPTAFSSAYARYAPLDWSAYTVVCLRMSNILYESIVCMLKMHNHYLHLFNIDIPVHLCPWTSRPAIFFWHIAHGSVRCIRLNFIVCPPVVLPDAPSFVGDIDIRSFIIAVRIAKRSSSESSECPLPSLFRLSNALRCRRARMKPSRRLFVLLVGLYKKKTVKTIIYIEWSYLRWRCFTAVSITIRNFGTFGARRSSKHFQLQIE